MIPSYYLINVAKKNKKGQYVHLFATAQHSLTDKKTAEDVFELFKEKFPSPEYNLELSHVVCYSERLKEA